MALKSINKSTYTISYGSYKMNTCFLVLQFSLTRFGCDYLAEAVTVVTEHLVSGKCFAENSPFSILSNSAYLITNLNYSDSFFHTKRKKNM